MSETMGSGSEPPDEVEAWLRQAFADIMEINPDSVKIGPNTVIADTDLDSIAVVETVDAAEEAFGITILDTELAEVITTGDLLDVIKRLRSERGDDDGLAGVSEPREPIPNSGSGGATEQVPEYDRS